MNLLNTAKKEWENTVFVLVGLILIFVLPSLNLLGEESSLYMTSSSLSTWGKYVCYAVLAMSLNFLWGYTGLLCLCQNLFFALGAYAFGMYLMLNIGVDTVYNTAMPDFMDQLGYTELPSHWEPFNSFILSVLAVFVVPGIVAFIFGFLVFRSRIKGVYFSIITQALTYACSVLFNRNETTMGGTNGFTNFKEVLGADIQSAQSTRTIFIISVVLMIVCYFLISWFVNSKFGKVQKAIRDSENRVLFSGYSTVSFKLFIFTVSAMMAGAAGALYLPQAGIINPTEMSTTYGLDVVVWVALGGRGSKFGPILGAILVNFIKSWASVEYPDTWIFILGALFIFVVIFMPNGIMGLPAQIKAFFNNDKSEGDDVSESGEAEELGLES